MKSYKQGREMYRIRVLRKFQESSTFLSNKKGQPFSIAL